jgi:hypothetical protein
MIHAPLCTVDRDYVLVIERALKAADITPALIPDPGRPTHYIVQVAEEDVDQATAALKKYGRFIPQEEA